ncbi:TIGR01777 family oxidoreductase [Granulicoccus sp. GXG6511]|uniref:TIGR01777 family oxidoreductase n=1 Tax=Granulicoccus sp. GXG6511 TaxID=3381351 RepID=UPI003D7DB5DA
MTMRIAISGSSGFLGAALVERLEGEHEIIRLVRRPARSPLERRWDPEAGFIESLGLTDIDAVVNLSGAGIADRRWSEARRRELLASRVRATRTLARLIAAEDRPALFLSGSAVGFYGSTGDHVIDETAPAGTGFLADLCRQWEAATADAGVRTVHLRTGLPLDRAGGFLGKQLPLFRLGLGGPMGDGQHWLPWIALEDWVNAVAHVLTEDISGPVNLSAPSPVTNAEFTAELGRQLGRPTKLPVPLPALRAIFGGQLVEEALLASNRMVPGKLLESGFEFSHWTLPSALSAALER